MGPLTADSKCSSFVCWKKNFTGQHLDVAALGWPIVHDSNRGWCCQPPFFPSNVGIYRFFLKSTMKPKKSREILSSTFQVSIVPDHRFIPKGKWSNLTNAHNFFRWVLNLNHQLEESNFCCPSKPFWVVVWNMFYFHPYWGKITHFDEYFSDGFKPPTSCDFIFTVILVIWHDDIWR